MNNRYRLMDAMVVGCALVCGGLVYGRYVPSTEADDAVAAASSSLAADRIQSGLVLLYDFRSSSGNVVKDRSGVGKPLDLRIGDIKAVRRSEGSLEVDAQVLIRSDGPAVKIIDAVRRSGETTIEAWVSPANVKQDGPARVVSLSKHTSERNFTLGQEGSRFDMRLRTTKTSANGLPSLGSPSKSLTTKLTHVVFTRDRGGRTRFYIDAEVRAEGKATGDASNWDRSFRLALANELTGDRPWLGAYHLVAIYSRALSGVEVGQNFRAGAQALISPEALATRQRRVAERFFAKQVAPLLAEHCLECHDSTSRKGGLDLSQRDRAFKGGDSGTVIVAGKASASLLWEQVESDEMPQKRSSLSREEKKLLQQWIDSGAIWSLDAIDPAVYAHDRRAGQVWVQRLTLREYIATVRSAVGVDIADEAREILPADLRADGFSNTAYNQTVDLKHIKAYARLAEIIVKRMDVQAFAVRFSRSTKLTDDDMRRLIAAMGKWLLRGPLDEHEIVTYRGISTTVASAGGDFEEAVRYIVEAMLQSPRFIYRIENQHGTGSPVGQYELASRMSYIIWGGPPDGELIRVADAGQLSDPSRIRAQAERMLRDPRAVERSRQFIYEWLDLGRLENMRPDPNKFPDWDAQLAADMRAETLAFFVDVVWKQKRPMADLLNAQVTFATPRLAKHYGLPLQDRRRGTGQTRYELSSVPGRGGLLTQGSVLTIGGDEASMVTRGLFVLHELLRGAVKDPPPCVDTTPVPTKAGLTQRGIAQARIANANCGGCHVKFEPLAFGLEKFDGLGAYHETDKHGNKLRDDGDILFPGTSKPVAYKSSVELMDLLADSDRVSECLSWKVAQFALGRPLVSADAQTIAKIHRSAQAAGGTYASLISAIVMSDLVRTARTEANR